MSGFEDVYVWIDRDRDGVQDAGETYTTEVKAWWSRVGVAPGENMERTDYTGCRVELFGEDFRFMAGAEAIERGMPIYIWGRVPFGGGALAAIFTGFVKSVDMHGADRVIVYGETQTAYLKSMVEIGLLTDTSTVDVMRAVLAAAPIRRYDTVGDFILGVAVLPATLITGEYIVEEAAAHSLFPLPASPAGVLTIPYAGDWTNQTAYDIIKAFVEAELGWFYVNEAGKFVFKTAASIDAGGATTTLNQSQIWEVRGNAHEDYYNKVEVIFSPRIVGAAAQTIYEAETSMRVGAGEKRRVILRFRDPDERGRVTGVLDIDGLTYTANTASDGSGSNVTSSVPVTIRKEFGGSCQILIHNKTAATAYVRNLTVTGQPLLLADDVRLTIENGVYTYENGVRPLVIRNLAISQIEDAQEMGDAIMALSQPDVVRLRTVRVEPALSWFIGVEIEITFTDVQTYMVSSVEIEVKEDDPIPRTVLGLKAITG